MEKHNKSFNRDNKNNRGSRDNRDRYDKPRDEFESAVIMTRRVSKVVKSGKKLTFTAAVVVGNKKGKLGFAVSKGLDPRSAIEKATRKAKKTLIKVKLANGTIPYELSEKFKSAKIYFKPAKPGTGLIVSNSIRPIIELGGVTDIYTKIYGTNNKITNSYCVISALQKLATA